MSNIVPAVLSALVVGAVLLSRRLARRPVSTPTGEDVTPTGEDVATTGPTEVFPRAGDEIFVPIVNMPAGSVPELPAASAAIVRVARIARRPAFGGGVQTSFVGPVVGWALGAERHLLGGVTAEVTIPRSSVTYVLRDGRVIIQNDAAFAQAAAVVTALMREFDRVRQRVETTLTAERLLNQPAIVRELALLEANLSNRNLRREAREIARLRAQVEALRPDLTTLPPLIPPPPV